MSAVAQREVRLRNIIDCDLLVLDDLFLSRTIPDAAGALLQTLIHQRYKLHRSVIVTSNRVVQDWGAYLGDNTMSTPILDRLMRHCHLLEFDGRSYRLKQAAETLARETKFKLTIHPCPASRVEEFDRPHPGEFELTVRGPENKATAWPHTVGSSSWPFNWSEFWASQLG
jgi:hypothetical protein